MIRLNFCTPSDPDDDAFTVDGESFQITYDLIRDDQDLTIARLTPEGWVVLDRYIHTDIVVEAF